jgi:hypothetical protein
MEVVLATIPLEFSHSDEQQHGEWPEIALMGMIALTTQIAQIFEM